MPGIRAVMFDVGGTLIEAYPSVGHVYSRVAARHALHVDPDDLNRNFRSAWRSERVRTTSIDTLFWKSVVSKTFHPFVNPVPEELFKDLYQEFSRPEVWRVFPEVKSTLEKLKKEKITAAVASNWDERLPKLLKDLNLDSYFDHQFISFEVGFSKPQSQFFEICLKRLGWRAEEVLHVGDDEENDMAGPARVGINSLLIRRNKQVGENKNSIESLAEVFSRL